MNRPNCKCHGEPMTRNGYETRFGGCIPKWRCSVKNRERFFERLANDPVYRITSAMRSDRYARARVVESRKRAADRLTSQLRKG